MVLAAGKATRLRPLTDNCPKCLMPLAGRPLIDWTLSWLRDAGVTASVINLHYLPDMVKDYVGDGSRYNIEVHYSYEPELMGTAGAVKKTGDFFAEEPFYVIYSDNFSQWDLRKLRGRGKLGTVPIFLAKKWDCPQFPAVEKDFFCHSGLDPESSKDLKTMDSGFRRNDDRAADEKMGQSPFFTMAVHWREDVTSSGMVVTDQDERILRYVEKPKAEDVVSQWVNAGFYYLHQKVLDYIPEGQFYDFSYHVFPAMLAAGEPLYAVKMEDPIIGIDTIAAYERANKYAEELSERSGFPLSRE